MNYTIESSSVAYRGKILSVHVDEIKYSATGRKSKREVVVKDDFAIVIPVRPDGTIVTVRQFRHPFQESAVSFPAGRADEGEEPYAAAMRELEEEAGLRAGRMTKLATLHEVPEFARSVGHLYIASALQEVPTRREEGEATMITEAFSEQELRRLVASGAIKSVTVQACIYHYLEHQGRIAAPQPTLAMQTTLSVAFAASACILLAYLVAKR